MVTSAESLIARSLDPTDVFLCRNLGIMDGVVHDHTAAVEVQQPGGEIILSSGFGTFWEGSAKLTCRCWDRGCRWYGRDRSQYRSWREKEWRLAEPAKFWRFDSNQSMELIQLMWRWKMVVHLVGDERNSGESTCQEPWHNHSQWCPSAQWYLSCTGHSICW